MFFVGENFVSDERNAWVEIRLKNKKSNFELLHLLSEIVVSGVIYPNRRQFKGSDGQ